MPSFCLLPDEDEEAFLLRRGAEERDLAERQPCIIGALHEDMADTYEDRFKELAEATAELEALAAKIR